MEEAQMRRSGIRGKTASALFLCVAMVVSTTPAFAHRCPLTQGFWKNHPKDWPVSFLKIGGTPYSQADLLVILETPPSGGNAALILAHQLIAADLNVAHGSTPVVSATIKDANTLLGTACGSSLGS